MGVVVSDGLVVGGVSPAWAAGMARGLAVLVRSSGQGVGRTSEGVDGPEGFGEWR